jgi:hypothetical protein
VASTPREVRTYLKSPEEDNEASELYEAEEVLGVVFPTDEDAALPEAQLYQPNFVVIGGMHADRERQSMTIHDCHDFHAFPTLRRSDPRPATFRHHERRIDEAFRFIQAAFVARSSLATSINTRRKTSSWHQV